VDPDELAGFEEKLRAQAPGTFFLYKKLSDDQKRTVFQTYQATRSFNTAREKIIELTRGR